jgi:hypothetical protein
VATNVAVGVAKVVGRGIDVACGVADTVRVLVVVGVDVKVEVGVDVTAAWLLALVDVGVDPARSV